MTEQTPIRIGIAGAGRIVRDEHVPRFRAIHGVELVSLASQTIESAHRAGAALGIGRVAPHWADLVADPAIDAVLIGAWPYLHAPIAIAALESGKHVLTEARMAADGAAAEAMLEASLTFPGQVAMVVPSSFSLWADGAIARVLGDGTIGRLLAVRVDWDAGPGTDPGDHWRWQRRYSGTNTMALGIVYEAMARWLGQAEWVAAETRIVEPRKPGVDGRPIATDVADHLVAMAGFPGGVPATIEMSTVSRRGQPNVVTFTGSTGTLEADFSAGRLAVVRPGAAGGAGGSAGAAARENVEIAPGEHDEWRAELDFVAAIRRQAPVTLTDFATGMRYMRFVDAVDESAATGARVRLAGA
jgi:predicted dehydrogenase